MSITIRTREMAVKNPSTGQYDAFDAIAIDDTADLAAQVDTLSDEIVESNT